MRQPPSTFINTGRHSSLEAAAQENNFMKCPKCGAEMSKGAPHAAGNAYQHECPIAARLSEKQGNENAPRRKAIRCSVSHT